MSYQPARLGVVRFALFALPLLAACSAPADDGAETMSENALTADATVHFKTSGIETTGALAVGETLHIDYDANRLTGCRGGNNNGGPGWTITGHYRENGGDVKDLWVAGFAPTPQTPAPAIALDRAGDLEIWFENTSMFGCQAWDSNYGQNFHFQVGASPNAPGWMGNLSVIMSRECENGRGDSCDRDRQPSPDGSFLFDTWARQRAATTTLSFEVWKQGVTDFDNADLWKELDVRVYSRIGSTGDFAMQYVSFDQRVGNNARYAVDLRKNDPIAGTATISSRANCPAFPIVDEGNGYVKADFEYYFVVNGAELRPTANGVFHGTYENYQGPYAVCVSAN